MVCDVNLAISSMLRSAFIVRNRQSKGILLVCLILKVGAL